MKAYFKNDFRAFSLSALAAGLLAALVGFSGSFAIVVQGFQSVGASAAEAASGLMAVSVAMGVCGIALSWKTKMPIGAAWSTPGAAFLVTLSPPADGFAAAVGAFLVTGALFVATGLCKPLGRAISAIPIPLGGAMLAGVLLPLCLAPFQAVVQFPAVGIILIVVWAAVGGVNRLLAMPVTVLVAAVLIGATLDAERAPFVWWATPVLVAPTFTAQAIVSIALPLYLITMASQNIAGIAVLKSFGYRASPAVFVWTGAFSLASAPFGGHAVNLAAITTAICAGPDAHPDPRRRYWAAVVCCAAYVLLGGLAVAAVAFIGMSPPILIAAVAGLALIGALSSALVSALESDTDRVAALITFLITASGVTWLGIGGVFWGLLGGGAVYWWNRRGR